MVLPLSGIKILEDIGLGVVFRDPRPDHRLVGIVGTSRNLSALQQTFYQDLVLDLERQHRTDLHAFFLQEDIQRLPLGLRTGKSVEDKSLGLRILFHHILEHGDGYLVRHQMPLLDVGLGQFAQLRPVLDVLAEHIAGGDVHQSVFLFQELCLSPFSRPRRAEKHDVDHLVDR